MTRDEAPKGGPTESAGKLDTPDDSGEQLDLFATPAVGRARKRDPQTSVDAARRARAPEQVRAILWALSTLPYPITGDDVADATGIRVDIVRTRLPQMRTKGLTVVAGRGQARGAHGGTVQAWELTVAGWGALSALKAS